VNSLKWMMLGSILFSPVIALHAETNQLLDDSSLTLGNLVVSGASDGPLMSRNISTSVDILDQERIEDQNVNYTWQLFDQLPGVMLTQYNMGNESGKISFRGFNGEGEVNAVSVIDLAARIGVSLPICEAVHSVLHRGADLEQTFRDLWARPIEAEPNALGLSFRHPFGAGARA